MPGLRRRLYLHIRPLTLLGGSALLICASTPALAATVTFEMTGGDPAYATFGRSVIDPTTNNRVNSTMQGGRFKLVNQNSGTFTEDFVGPDPTFWAFCIEPRESIGNGIHTLEVKPLWEGTSNIGGMGLAKANKLSELFGRWYPDMSASLTTVQAGALQIAVWEIVREDTGPLDIYNGSIYFYSTSGTTAGVLALAQSYVQAIDGTGPKAPGLVALYRVGTQDLIVQLSNPPEEVPEPATMAICGAGLLLVGFRKWRSTRRCSARR